MSEENKQKEKLKSTLSADVPPFVPRNFNLGLLNNIVPEANKISQVSHYVQDAAEAKEGKWHIPVIPPASPGIMLLPVTPLLHPDYQFQLSSQGDGFLQASQFQSADNHFPSQGKKNHTRKRIEGRLVAAGNEINVKDDSFSHVPPESEAKKREEEVSNYLNSKIKFNHEKDNINNKKTQLKILTAHKTLKCPVKLDNNLEFPSLPTVSNKDIIQNQLCKSETYQSTQHCSYSSILQSMPKHSSDLNQGPVLSNSKNEVVTNIKEEEIFHQNIHRKQKSKRKFEVNKGIHSAHGCKAHNSIENEQNANLKEIKNQKNNKYQIECNVTDSKQSTSKHVEFVIEKNKASQKKCFGNKMENTKMLERQSKSIVLSKEESNVTDNISKPQKNEKKKKRNKKKKKLDPGKVSLLSPEQFATITNKMNEVSKLNQNDGFNLCDQQDFPNLCSSLLTPVVENMETEKFNAVELKQNKISLINNTSSSEKPFNLNFSNLWKPTTYSDILQAANKFRNNEKDNQTSVNSLKKSSSVCKKQDTMVTSLKKKERKKKKKSNVASDNSRKVQTDEKQVKADSVIQISIAGMVTSLQHLKLNQIKKKDTKTRVISTKRGIMDKMANPHNMLDSSAPMKKRGKEREKPGRKRLSAMRKVILREREKRRMQSLEETKCKSEEDDSADKETDDTNADVASSHQDFTDTCESCSKDNSEQVDRKLQASKIILHTKKFRDYCDHMISEEIDSTVMTILKDLVRFQDRLHEKDPIKARMKRRLVYGLREVTKHLRLCKLRCIFIAPNIEKISSEGGLSDALQVIIKLAQEQNIPYIFALQRRTLGKVCMKIVPVSCVGIFNYEGVEENYYKLLEFLTEAREKYNETLKIICNYITEDIELQLLEANISPAAIQPIRSEVLSKISVHNMMSERTPSKESCIENSAEESNTEQDINDI